MATRPTTTTPLVHDLRKEDDMETPNPYQRHDRALLVTVAEAAELLSIGRSNTYRLINEGQLASVKIGARRLVPRASLEAFVQELLEAS